ncbi:hypothetical protein [Streptomyces chartreusis]|uniref:Uncharacterized protein n=1 Tax=Streptomyces chartreusis TaxID=1969 RepID=A0A7H8TBE1_STRCX|nr:hypothetical protein [Streptomyces chartreusis]QKZ20831.1 hypothetical protein HUT05_27880 [Streptomyces chartreusis]
MGDQGEQLEDLAHRLVQALDAWATCVGEPTEKGKPKRTTLVAALEKERQTPAWQSRKKIDEPLLSYWLKGRDQLQPGIKHNRLPSVEDCEAIARALKEKTPQNAQQLPRIGREIADLARSLRETEGPGWRNRVLAGVTGQTAEPVEGAEMAEPVEPDEAAEPHEVANPAEPAEPDGAAGPAQPIEPARAAEPVGGAEHAAGRHTWKNKRVWTGTAAAVGVVGAIALIVWPGGGESSSAGQKPNRSAAPSATGVDLTKPGQAASIESGGLEGNHRCGKARSAGAVSWTPCTLVTKDRAMSFLVQFTNTSGKPVTVKAKLAYVQAAVEQTCPDPWGTAVKVTIPAQATKTSPLDACSASLTPAQAFQARVWVVPDGAAQWGYREHSPTLHVQDNGTPLWADEV